MYLNTHIYTCMCMYIYLHTWENLGYENSHTFLCISLHFVFLYLTLQSSLLFPPLPSQINYSWPGILEYIDFYLLEIQFNFKDKTMHKTEIRVDQAEVTASSLEELVTSKRQHNEEKLESMICLLDCFS